MEQQSKAPRGTQAILRTVRLLKAFSPEKPRMTLAELGAAVGLTRSTAHRLLAALESEGLVTRGRSRSTYCLGPAVIALGSQALLSSDLRRTARPALDELAEAFGETTTLEVLIGDEILVLDGIAGRRLVSAGLDTGTRWPAFATSTGRCILAHLPEFRREYLLHLPRPRLTDKTRTGIRELRAELAVVRKRGFAATFGELGPEYAAVAAAFFGPTGEVEGALCVGGPVTRFTAERVEEIGAKLSKAADQLSTYEPGALRGT
ncbi:MAG: IclR family transcriptional regulator [Myxococcota bacterium]